jgi:hypothetical protein
LQQIPGHARGADNGLDGFRHEDAPINMTTANSGISMRFAVTVFGVVFMVVISHGASVMRPR